jgi:hypothetical protein
MYSASAPGMDIYTIPLFNGHEIRSTSVVSGFPPSAAAPVCIGVNNTPAGLIQVWFLVKTTLYYGINVTVVGPAGVPYHAAW